MSDDVTEDPEFPGTPLMPGGTFVGLSIRNPVVPPAALREMSIRLSHSGPGARSLVAALEAEIVRRREALAAPTQREPSVLLPQEGQTKPQASALPMPCGHPVNNIRQEAGGGPKTVCSGCERIQLFIDQRHPLASGDLLAFEWEVRRAVYEEEGLKR